MTQTQFLLFVIAAIPLINCLMIKICTESPKLFNISNKALPILFAMNLIGLYSSLSSDNSYLTIAEAMRGISLGFLVDKIGFAFLILLNFFWIIFTFYSQRFFKINPTKNSDELRFYFSLAIAFVNLIILSKNLLSILFFYNCLILFCYFFALKFLHKSETKFSRFFSFLLYLESLFFFLAIIATHKFTNQIDFVNGGIIGENFDRIKHGFLLGLYLAGLFLSVLIPSYLLYRNINLDSLTLYVFFFLSYALVSLYVFVKLLVFIFGFQGFGIIVKEIGFKVFEIIFLFDVLAVSAFLMFSKGLKSSFFYLFFHQFTFTLFEVFLLGRFNYERIGIAIFSFLLSFTLIFLSISNLILYLSKAQNKRLDGLFYNLIITCSLFVFAIANMIGFAPAIGAVEKFFVIKVIIQNKLWISGVIFLINLVSLGFLAWKMIFPLFVRLKEEKSVEDSDLAKNIDFDSSLMLTGLIVAVIMFLGLILFPLLTNLFT